MMYIYCLRDPSTTTIHYVGLTNSPTRREANHLYGRVRTANQVAAWIDSLPTPPVMQIVCIVEDFEGKRMEDSFKQSLLKKGIPLLNDASKRWNHPHSEEARRKISEAKKRYWADRRKA